MPADLNTIFGSEGEIAVHTWPAKDPRGSVLIVHGYGEHAGRYDHVAEHLVAQGFCVRALDHLGHGRSAGERALVADFDHLVDDVRKVYEGMVLAGPGLPVVVLGHSLGGLIATRFVQTGTTPAGLVLSGPFIGGNPDNEGLLGLDPMPDVPIDPAALSRDPSVGEAYLADELVYHGPFLRPTLEQCMGAVRAVAEGPGFGALPVLWVHGEEDVLAPVGPVQKVLDRLHGSSFAGHVLPGARHEVLNETNRDEVLALVTAFVAEVVEEVRGRPKANA